LDGLELVTDCLNAHHTPDPKRVQAFDQPYAAGRDVTFLSLSSPLSSLSLFGSGTRYAVQAWEVECTHCDLNSVHYRSDFEHVAPSRDVYVLSKLSQSCVSQISLALG